MLFSNVKISYTLIVIIGILVATAAVFYIDYKQNVSDLTFQAERSSTIANPKTDYVRLLVIGDSGTGSENQKEVALGMERRCRKKKADGILHLGDAIYPTGVTSVDDPQWQEKMFSVYSGSCVGNLPIYPVLGNHDYLGDVGSWIEMGKRNPRWQFPSRHYSILFPDLLTIYALDSNYPVQIKSHGIPNFGQSNTPWTIAIGHHPLQSQTATGGGHKGFGVRPWLLKKYLCNTVDGYFSGHTHQMEFDTVDNCKLDHYISAAGGGALYAIKPNHSAIFAMSRYGFLELEFSKDQMKSRFFSKDGELLFKHTRERSGEH